RRNCSRVRMRSRTLSPSSAPPPNAATIFASVPSIQAAIMSIAPPGNASRATAGSTPAAAAACASALSFHPSNTAARAISGASAPAGRGALRRRLLAPPGERRRGGAPRREREPQLVERALVAGERLGQKLGP